MSIEYTSLDISRRLTEAGFKAEYDGRCWIHTDNERLAGSFLGYRTANSTENVIADAYRSDTLLAFLVGKGWDVSVGKPHDKWLVDIASMKENRGLAIEGDTLPDVLADAVFAIIAPAPKEKAR